MKSVIIVRGVDGREEREVEENIRDLQLARLEENPLLPHHRKLSAAFLEERVGLRD